MTDQVAPTDGSGMSGRCAACSSTPSTCTPTIERSRTILGGHLDRLDEPLRVAIAGKMKSGKSTLLNVLVGEEIAPTDAGECTRILTWYQYGSRPRCHARAKRWSVTRAGDPPSRGSPSAGPTRRGAGRRRAAHRRVAVAQPASEHDRRHARYRLAVGSRVTPHADVLDAGGRAILRRRDHLPAPAPPCV